MTSMPDELQSIQKRVKALKAKPAPDAPKPGRPRGLRVKGSRVIDGVLYSPEQVKAMGLDRDGNERNRSRNERAGRGGNRQTVQGDERISGAAPTQFDRRNQGYPGSRESDTTDVERPLADYDQSERDGREAITASRDRDTRAYPGNNRAEGITSRLRESATGAVENAFSWMANIGKPSDKDRDEDDGPSHNGNGFRPVERVAEFVQEEYAQPFTEREATEREQEVIDMIVGYSEDLDVFLSISNADEFKVEGATSLWSMDDEEAAPIARIWLKRAKKDRRAAATLRMALQGDDYKRAAIVLGPRLWRTATFYRQHGGWKMTPWEDRR